VEKNSCCYDNLDVKTLIFFGEISFINFKDSKSLFNLKNGTVKKNYKIQGI